MAEAIPGTPVVREVRTGSGSESFYPASTTRGGPRADIDDGVREFEIQRMEKQAAKLEKDLILKELETLDFLEALASTKKVIEDLKLELKQRAARCIKSPEHFRSHVKEMNKEECIYRNPLPSPDLGKTMDDLGMIQSYVESLNLKAEEEKDFLGVASLAEELNSLRLKSGGQDQGERFSTEKLSVNPQCEEVKMVAEINDTTCYKQSKTCLRTAEMRLLAARKMEEAARAAEALAVAEMSTLSRGRSQDGLCFPEPPRTPLTLEAHLKEDLSTDISRTKILRKLEEANQEVKQSKKALERALNRVEIASLKQLEAEEAYRQWNIESWKNQKAIRRANRSVFKGDNFPRCTFSNHANKQHEEPVIDLPKPMLQRNVSIGNVLNRKQVPIVGEKQLVTPKRKFRFIHIKVPLEKQSEKQTNL